jgi:DeoR/GlpR family transcriptional regulator of sugar metabolism
VIKNSTTFDRQNRLLALLGECSGIRVTEIAQKSQVSEGTIRNDLNALANEWRLERVRGGGIPTDDHPINGLASNSRLLDNEIAKQQNARWAVELVEDSDIILLDASLLDQGKRQHPIPT